MREASLKDEDSKFPHLYFILIKAERRGQGGTKVNMKTIILRICFCFLGLNALAQTEPSMSVADKNALTGYEYIGDLDYLTVSSTDNRITTAYKWNVYLYGKPFGNTYIFKVYVTGAQKEKK